MQQTEKSLAILWIMTTWIPLIFIMIFIRLCKTLMWEHLHMLINLNIKTFSHIWIPSFWLDVDLSFEFYVWLQDWQLKYIHENYSQSLELNRTLVQVHARLIIIHLNSTNGRSVFSEIVFNDLFFFGPSALSRCVLVPHCEQQVLWQSGGGDGTP